MSRKIILIHFNPFEGTTTWFNIPRDTPALCFEWIFDIEKKYGRGFEVLFGSNYVTKTNSIKQIRQIDRFEGSADDTWTPDVTTQSPDGEESDEVEHGFEEDGCCGFEKGSK